MPFGRNTNIKKTAMMLLVVTALPITALAAVSEEHLAQVKDQFNELWHNAAETTKKRTELEETLANFDSKVADAKRDLAQATEDRKAIREQIAEQRRLIEVLTSQLKAAQDSRSFYTSLAFSQRDDYVRFIRYLASRDMTDSDTGPVAGGGILRYMLRGSLGDSIDDDLARQAANKARIRFFGQVNVLVDESGRAETRLAQISKDLQKQLTALEKKHSDIASLADEKAAFIDDSWRQKKLTQEEVIAVAKEADEASARMASIQSDLITINQELRDAKLKKLRAELDDLQSQYKTLETQRDTLQRKDEAMRLLQDAALKAFQVTVQQRNTDKKLYKHVEEKELARSLLIDKRDALPKDASGALIKSAALTDVQADIAEVEAVIKLMKDGVPTEYAEAYVRAKRQADEAAPVRAELRPQILALAPKLAVLQTAVSAKIGEVESAERDTGMDGLPPLFQWPVRGPITAGYFDADYETVFHVPHRAVDIATPQSSSVHAISDGIVLAVKDGGLTGYSYVLIGHRNGYASLYGHVSAALVRKGDVVMAGQIIALSGGTPGTHGAGPMTTGAHVHLEVTKDGEHINPLSILPAR